MVFTLTVDLSNKSATILGPDVTLMWSGVTRRTALEVAGADGWVQVDEWKLTSPPDGFYCHVRQVTPGELLTVVDTS